ncbi:SDR family oxidoreductase [Hymenobacter sp. J193]|uniref:SDR family oxidoreductase n=1 Tax=Hymenobacter sp. J193 TaxID=2898429 RepID=UPI0021507A4D|nr:SDR family oxidoreductase [Hymenobacter sp. J193]MCR5889592.1 SDR family oxidoreductase [Hymenobacter sp. J193]
MQKLIVVTGGTKGIGRAVVERFLAAGLPVVTCARSAADLLVLSSELARQYPDTPVYTLAADLSQPEDTQRFVSFVRELEGSVEVLVNNTGGFEPGRLQDEPADGSQLRRMIDVNLYSAYDVTQGLLPDMIARRHGHIFMLCSTASIMAYTNGGSYCIAKFALYGMTKVLRAELQEHDIRVTAILPGATLTNSWAGADLPAERFMRPQDVAESIFAAYSLSPQAVVEELLMRPQLGDI